MRGPDILRTRRSRWLPGLLVGLAVVGAAGLLSAVSNDPQKWAGSRVSPVHQIPLKDGLNQDIVPTETNPLPFSARFTCAPCHEYDKIKGGWHFNDTSGAPAGRMGEPWIWLDERTGTQIPLSYRSWKGTFNPKDLGLSAWDFTLLFGRHMPGGGAAEPAEADKTPESRWEVSGAIEINCFGCHNASPKQNPSEWAKQVLRENFRWAATAAAGLGEVLGMSSRLKATWDVFDGPNPDDSEWAVAPYIKYDRTLFDSKHKAFLNLSYKPADSNCLACHSAAPKGQAKRDYDDDVHSAAGIKCVDCHRNDVGHAMIRGYEGEGKDNPAAAGADFTCRGCHLGENPEGKPVKAGRLGAPRPAHKGLPKVHFDRLACTVCHSGPMPAKATAGVRTAKANRLGIFGVADWSTDLPAIQQPVYIRDDNKRLTPSRMMWPAYWARLEGNIVKPLKPADITTAAGDILFPENDAVAVLNALFSVPDINGTPVLVLDGRAFEVNADLGLSAVAAEAKSKGVFTPAWALLRDGKVVPMTAEFDPADVEASIEPETRIQNVLATLAAMPAAPGQPAWAYKGVVYKLVDGVFDKSESKDAPAAAPSLFWLKSEKRVPLLAEAKARAIAALNGTEQTLTEAQVEAVLKLLTAKAAAAKETGGEYVYIASGKLFRIGDKGTLIAKDNDAAAPVAWPFAHQVRPARQALGADACTDCHNGASDFFFAKTTPSGPLMTDKAKSRSAVSYMGMTQPFHRLFGLSFLIRPGFKIVLAIAAFVIASILAILFLTMLGRAAGLIEKRR
ncbi:MAG: hypothetical protein PHI34_06410 [Acidobacteriota bacterium]|nr:hypothetical protein [Acidobacteriota bacterium]